MQSEPIKYLQKCLLSLKTNQRSHYASAEKYQKINWFLGSMVVVVTASVGAFTFADLTQYPSWMIKVLNAASLLAAILAAVMTFSGFSDKASKHQKSGAEYGSLAREVETILSQELSQEKLELFTSKLNEDWQVVSMDAPLTYMSERLKQGDILDG